MVPLPPSGTRPPRYWGFTITLRRTKVCRTPPYEWSARRRDLYLTTYNTHKRETSMLPGGIRTHNLSKWAVADRRLTPRGQWDRRGSFTFIYLRTIVQLPILYSLEWHNSLWRTKRAGREVGCYGYMKVLCRNLSKTIWENFRQSQNNRPICRHFNPEACQSDAQMLAIHLRQSVI